MTTETATEPQPPVTPVVPAERKLTIGGVCKTLSREFPDISISKIRYLEDQKLVTPKRTPGGYRVYSGQDVQRLATILRLQRDEFLPLRVIREELALGRSRAEDAAEPNPARARAYGGVSVTRKPTLHPLEEVLDETGASTALIGQLEEFGLVKGVDREGQRCYDDAEREIIRAAAELAKYGVEGRNLRVFKTSADREAALLQQLLEPALRSRNSDRRKQAVESLEKLTTVTTHLKHLLLVRDLRKLVP